MPNTVILLSNFCGSDKMIVICYPINLVVKIEVLIYIPEVLQNPLILSNRRPTGINLY